MRPDTSDRDAGDGSAQPSGEICADLGALPPGTLITEKALAQLLGRSVKSIKRAVARGELPPPVRLVGASRWTAGAIVRHVEKRLEDAASQAQREKQRLDGQFP
jgi:predicted DNA-binding transcriptional regulator AlpA